MRTYIESAANSWNEPGAVVHTGKMRGVAANGGFEPKGDGATTIDGAELSDLDRKV